MNEISLNLWNWLLAFTPIITILVLMLWRRWGASKAGGLALLITLLIAWLRFGAPFTLLAYAHVKALLLALDVLWIIWNALILFHLTRQAGAIDKIGKTLSNLTPDRTMQALILGWVFPSFLQGMDGFGIPVAVSAPLLISLGFSPIMSVLMTSIGHSWAITFGSMASSFQILVAVTGLPGEVLAPFSLLLLGVACYVCGLIVAYLAGGWAGVKRNLPAILILGTVMSVTQYLVATHIVYNLAATLAGVTGLLACLVITRWQSRKTQAADGNVGKELVSAFSSYIILVAFALIINLVSPIKTFLSLVHITLNFPEVQTSLGWIVPAGSGRILKPFAHPGTIIMYASVASYFLFRHFNMLPKGSLRAVFHRLISAAEKSSAGIITMVTLSVVMTDSGMTQLLALGLSQSVGVVFYPLIAPLIGALGGFITGSNSNANVLFAVLQMHTAQLLNISVPLILAAQTAGGALGSVMSPAKVIVGCSTVGLSGEEGRVMPKILLYGLIPIMTVGLLAFLLQWLVL